MGVAARRRRHACKAWFGRHRKAAQRSPPECLGHTEALWSSALASPAAWACDRLSGREPGMGALTDQAAFELREGCENVEDQLACRAICFDLLGQALKTAPRALRLGHGQAGCGPADSVATPPAYATSGGFAALLKFWRVALQVQMLVLPRAPRHNRYADSLTNPSR